MGDPPPKGSAWDHRHPAPSRDEGPKSPPGSPVRRAFSCLGDEEDLKTAKIWRILGGGYGEKAAICCILIYGLYRAGVSLTSLHLARRSHPRG